ncbi:nuclear transport factor 2 family protein [Mucilaginibacter terrigena]|uniref:Nuclear transport factor 2 family protein n=1 Tax=Mucilaginibacter terrigena TaxID=2492395 RepID=A0A4Q5LRE2_9SPHI|nr:SnoaL-like domain-containing protein [Mucilaginibacter terrigena]RYU91919.1 nuclear transport factor 2 family protein [Mucilaginibacter terrigena]
MNRRSIEEALNSLNELVLQGKLMEAFETYYHENVSMQENNLAPTVSKAANRAREVEFLSNVTEFRGAKVKALGVGDGVSFVMWKYDYTHKEWGVRNYTQISVQQWQDGQIINEQFIYAN